ncbi:hypothetical protein X975_06518, partial [Stegodyphus mimosarum]
MKNIDLIIILYIVLKEFQKLMVKAYLPTFTNFLQFLRKCVCLYDFTIVIHFLPFSSVFSDFCRNFRIFRQLHRVLLPTTDYFESSNLRFLPTRRLTSQSNAPNLFLLLFSLWAPDYFFCVRFSSKGITQLRLGERGLSHSVFFFCLFVCLHALRIFLICRCYEMSSQKPYSQYFRPAYRAEFPTIKESFKGNNYAFCYVCMCDFIISHGGRSNIVKHVTSKKHEVNASASTTSKKVDDFFSNSDADVILAECLFTAFLIEHNVTLSAADHAGQLFRQMIPDSKIAQKYACARTTYQFFKQEFMNLFIIYTN